MYLSKRVKVVAGVSALLGLVLAGGAGFTASGITDAAPTSAFLGGTVSQTVSGIQLDSITYSQVAGAGSAVNLITLVFEGNAEANTAHWVPSLVLTQDSSGPTDITCEGIDVADPSPTSPLTALSAASYTAYCDLDNVTGINNVAVTLGDETWG